MLTAVVFLLIVAPSYLTPLMVVRTFGDEVWKLTVNELAFSVGMVLGGAARLAFHGIDRILAGSSALLPQGGRINLTLRRVTKPED